MPENHKDNVKHKELRKDALNRWQVMVESDTKDDFMARFTNLCRLYKGQAASVKYLEKELRKYWTSKVQYFSNATTCRLCQKVDEAD